MKKYLLLLLAVSGFAQTPFSGGIKTSRIDGYVNQDISINSTTGGLLIPRMTTTQKEAIVSPTMFTQVIDVTLGKHQYYDGSAWVDSFGGGSQNLLQVLNNGYQATGKDIELTVDNVTDPDNPGGGLILKDLETGVVVDFRPFSNRVYDVLGNQVQFTPTQFSATSADTGNSIQFNGNNVSSQHNGVSGNINIDFEDADDGTISTFRIPAFGEEIQIAATREWVEEQGYSTGGGAVDSVNGKTGVVTLNQDEVPDGTTYKQYS